MQRNLKRVVRDYQQLVDEGPLNGVWIKPVVEDNMDKFYVMIRGPIDTPYAGCIFFFVLEPWVSYNSNSNGLTYPANPPKFLHISPYSFRSHPNLYRGWEAKVCLSILGTWAGPSWTPMMTFMTICQTVLSILDNEPLRNEPAYEKRNDPRIAIYTKYVQFSCMRETITKIILPVLENQTFIPNDPISFFKDEIKSIWAEHAGWYLEKLTSLSDPNEKVPASSYGDTSYVNSPYTFHDLIESLLSKIIT